MSSVLGAAPSILLGAAVGGAASAALEPVFEPARQQAWENAPNRLLAPPVIARLIAQGGIPLDDNARNHVKREGFREDSLNALVYLETVVPGFGEAVRILRRDPSFADLFTHALVKQGIDTRYYDGLTDLQHERLDPAVIALAIVRGIIADPHTANYPDGFLPVGPPTAEGNVKAFPTSPINGMTEAEAAGWNDQRLFVQTAISGRPMGPEAAAAGVFRGVLKPADYQRAIAEGDVRNEWAQAIFDVARQIPSPSDYVRMAIKGWIKPDDMHAGAARHGMSADDVDLLYLAAGRPAAPGQMATAVARGVDGPDGTPMDETQFLKGIRESDIRPEWGPMLWGIRYQYPPLFQLSRLVQSGAIDGDTAAAWAANDRYAPEVIEALRKSWNAGAAASTTATRAKTAQTQAIAAVKKSFMRGDDTPELAIIALEQLGLDNAEAEQVVHYWQTELTFTAKLLTPAQIKKAYSENLKDRDTAIAELVAQHFSVADANTFLTI